MSKSTLSMKQQRFVAEYLKDWNATKAAERAGYSKRSANEQACDLMKIPKIKAAVDKGFKTIQDKAGATAERILQELWNIASVDLRRAYNDDGSLKPIQEIPEDVVRALGSVDVDELFDGVGKDRERIGVTKRIRFWDKIKALELLGRNLKMFTDKTELSDQNGAPVIIQFASANYDAAKNSQRSDDKGL